MTIPFSVEEEIFILGFMTGAAKYGGSGKVRLSIADILY